MEKHEQLDNRPHISDDSSSDEDDQINVNLLPTEEERRNEHFFVETGGLIPPTPEATIACALRQVQTPQISNPIVGRGNLPRPPSVRRYPSLPSLNQPTPRQPSAPVYRPDVLAAITTYHEFLTPAPQQTQGEQTTQRRPPIYRRGIPRTQVRPANKVSSSICVMQ